MCWDVFVNKYKHCSNLSLRWHLVVILNVMKCENKLIAAIWTVFLIFNISCCYALGLCVIILAVILERTVRK